MSLSRHGSGPAAWLRAYGSQVHPVFMLPPLATSLFGALLAGYVDPSVAVVHLVAIFAAVYTAHLKDGYIDFHIRSEDEDHPLTRRGCRLGLGGSTALFVVACIVLWYLAGGVALVLTAPTWMIAYGHAPQLDTTTVGATLGYPVGIGLALLGGFAAQSATATAQPLAFAMVFVVLLSGIKVIDDAQDVAFDRAIGKPTVAVMVGTDRAIASAYATMAVGLTAVIALAFLRVFPLSSVIAVLAFVPVAWVARRAPPTLATMLLVRATYVFLAVLVVAVWFEPLEPIRP